MSRSWNPRPSGRGGCQLGANLAGQGLLGQLGGGDDGAAAAPLQGGAGGLALGEHAAGGELAGRGVGGQGGRAQLVQVALAGPAEVDGDVLDPGEDQQDLGAQPVSEQGPGQVLVDHRLDPAQGAGGPADSGSAGGA